MTFIVRRKFTSERVKRMAEHDARWRNLLLSPQQKVAAIIWEDRLPSIKALSRIIYRKIGRGHYIVWDTKSKRIVLRELNIR